MSATANDLYCGDKNCYSLLGVEKDATDKAIKKSYYKLSMKYHPDRTKKLAPKEKEEANEEFLKISNAYEVLSKTREEYDDALAHPEKLFRNRFRYYRYRTKNIDVRIIAVGLILFATIAHWIHWVYRHNRIKRHLMMDRKVQARIHERKAMLKKQGLENTEVTLDDVNVKVGGWQGRPPRWDDVLCLQMLFWPLKLYHFAYWHGSWIVKYSLLKQEYSDFDKDYLTYSVLNKLQRGRLTYSMWETQFPENQKESLIEKELWVQENLKVYLAEMRAPKKKYGKRR